MASNNTKALVNYYARLIKKGSYVIEEVPKEYRPDVRAKLNELPDPKPDPVTQTPEEK